MYLIDKMKQYLVPKISKNYLTEVTSSETRTTKKTEAEAKRPKEKLKSKAAKFSKSSTPKSAPWEVSAEQFFDKITNEKKVRFDEISSGKSW